MNFKFKIQLRKAIDCFYEQIKCKSKVNIDLHEKQISMIKLANKIMFSIKQISKHEFEL